MKKVVSLLIVISMLLTSMVFAAEFNDLSKNHWAYGSIAEMTKKGILAGYPDGSFAPEKAVTRAEFAKILVLTLELEEKTEKMEFLDVAEEHWAYKYINTASDYLSAYKNGNQFMYLPNDAAVREDVAVAVVMAAGLQDINYNLKTLDNFSDKEQISEGFRKYVAIAAENKLMNGNADGTFNPKGKLTRAEICKLMMNTIDEFDKVVIVDQNNNGVSYGDVNVDGALNLKDLVMLARYLNKDFGEKITSKGLKNADVNADGKVNGTDIMVIQMVLSKWDVTMPAKGITAYGDVTLDGELNTGDVTKLTKYLTGKAALNAEAKKNADFNGDGIINETDVTSLKAYLESQSGTKYIIPLGTPGESVETIEPTKETVYGDVNEDGVVNGKDSIRLLSYIKNATTLTEQGLKNSELNKDGKVNGTDYAILSMALLDKTMKLPAEGIIAYGDVTLDGNLDNGDTSKIIEHISGTEVLSGQAKKNADFNGDGKINQTDVTSLKAYFESQPDRLNVYPLLQPGETVEPTKETIYGDVNADGEFDGIDTLRLLKYLNGFENTTIPEQGMKNADVNLDGKVNGTDVLIMELVLADWDVTMPAKNVTSYGDVTLDGKLNDEDATKLTNYIAGKVALNAETKKNADFNGDGIINETDVTSLKAYLESQSGTKYIIPLGTPGKTVEPEKPVETLYGDVNVDGEIDTRDSLMLMRYLSNYNGTTITEQGMKNADVDANGKVNGTDVMIIDIFLADWGITMPANGITAYGDVTLDGRLNEEDVTKLTQYLSGKVALNAEAKKNADFNGDGIINDTDVTSLKAYLESQSGTKYITPLETPGETVEPEKPVETLYGDVNVDGEIDTRDSVVLMRYLSNYNGTTITEQGMKNADVDANGKVNGTDVMIIDIFLADWGITMPAKGITAYGDVTLDGRLNEEDVTKLTNYIAGKVALNAEAKKNADFNGDGIINDTDVTSLKAYIESQSGIKYITPLETPGETVEPVETVYGDVDTDGKFDAPDILRLLKYLNDNKSTTITEQGLINSDVNLDGKVNGTDVMVMKAVRSGWDITMPAKGITAYGDVTLDGNLDNGDTNIIIEYIAGKTTLNAQAKKNADFNGDGKIDQTDVTSLKAYFEEQPDRLNVHPLVQPGKTVEPINTIKYGDANVDGEFDGADVLRVLKKLNGFNTTIPEQGMKNADVNLDGKVNGTDVLIMELVLADWDVAMPAKDFTSYGDATLDGRLNLDDVTKITNYIAGKATLDAQAKKNADVNGNGKIDQADATSLKAYIDSKSNTEYIIPLAEPEKAA